MLANLPKHKCDPAGPSSSQSARIFTIKADVNAALYVPTHNCEPPADQIVTTETTGVLLRQFRARAAQRQQEKERQKRHGEDASETARKKARH